MEVYRRVNNYKKEHEVHERKVSIQKRRQLYEGTGKYMKGMEVYRRVNNYKKEQEVHEMNGSIQKGKQL